MASDTPLFDQSFNPLILGTFLSGMYLLLFVQAIWKLLQRRAHAPYICALILLWMSIMGSLIISVNLIRNAFVVNNSSPQSILVELAKPSSSLDVAVLPTILATVISDGIIVGFYDLSSQNSPHPNSQIWRSYVLWNSLWSVTIPIPLLLSALACNLDLAVAPTGETFLLIAGLSKMFSAATTLSATLLILLKIILVTRKSRARYSYSNIMGILVQSAALQSFVQTFYFIAVITFVKISESNNPNIPLVNTFLQLTAYSSSCQIAVVGIAPTLIAFRVADEKPRIKTSTASRAGPLSRITFRRSVHRTVAESGADQTRIANLHFGSVQENDLSDHMHSRVALGNIPALPEKSKSSQLEKLLTGSQI